MYGQNLGGRPDAPDEPIFTKCCMRVRVPDVFLSFESQKDRMKNVGAVGVEISPLPLKRHIAYTTACCYRTSRDFEGISCIGTDKEIKKKQEKLQENKS